MGSLYEKLREERIKENLNKIQKLGITDLSLKIKSLTPTNSNPRSRRRNLESSLAVTALPTPLRSRRRSSRLQNVDPVSYADMCMKKEEDGGDKSVKARALWVEQGEREEFYTDEHEALLGSCETSWELFVDGYGNDGRRIYDQVKGKTCHQCRQKTLGHHTNCCKCNLVQGQFCGDCLYMRYGENVLEVEKNATWICPVCRGICNCSLCRTKKGWAPTGSLYRRILKLGYKSVAHYLIQTRRQTNIENQIDANPSLSNKEDFLDDSKNAFHPEETTNEKSNDLQTVLIHFADSIEEPSNQKEFPEVDNIGSRLRKRRTKNDITKSNLENQIYANPSINKAKEENFLNDSKNALNVEETAGAKNDSQTKQIPCASTKEGLPSKKESPVADSIAGRLRKRRILSIIT